MDASTAQRTGSLVPSVCVTLVRQKTAQPLPPKRLRAFPARSLWAVGVMCQQTEGCWKMRHFDWV
eukprot:5174094-Amphidinium_carterae.1